MSLPSFSPGCAWKTVPAFSSQSFLRNIFLPKRRVVLLTLNLPLLDLLRALRTKTPRSPCQKRELLGNYPAFSIPISEGRGKWKRRDRFLRSIKNEGRTLRLENGPCVLQSIVSTKHLSSETPGCFIDS